MVQCVFKYFVYFVCLIKLAKQNPPSFRIVAPQVICEQENDQTNFISTQSATINFQPKNSAKLTYNCRIYFTNIGGFQSQKHSLEIWRAIRKLQARINSREKYQISERNFITVDSAELVPGIDYTFEVIAETEDGLKSEPQNFTIKFSNGVLERDKDPNSAAGLTFLLLGSETIYANVPYILNAKLSFCQPRYDYFFFWNISGLAPSADKYFQTSSSLLKIPANTFEGGKSYGIKVSVLQAIDSKLLTQDFLQLDVLKKGFEVFLTPSSATAGINKNIIIEVSIEEYDNSKSPLEINWECKTATEQLCEEFENTNQRKIEFRVREIDRYIINCIVKRDSFVRTASSKIQINDGVFTSWSFENTPKPIIPAGSPFEFHLIIHDLIPKCYAEWSLVTEEGYGSFDGKKIPGGLGNYTVKNIEEKFLSELVDYDNSTVSREVSLRVPRAEPKADWSGLKGNKFYQFRLISICPNAIGKPNEKDKLVENKFFDITIKTNSPPEGLPLEVTPNSGQALRTVFKFFTRSAKDDPTDAPFKYHFIYKVDSFIISLGEFYENKVVESPLPYSDTPIESAYQVCDSRLACKSIKGPNVTMELVDLTKEEIQLREKQITNAFLRMEFMSANYLILTTALTYQKFSEKQIFENFRRFASDLIIKEINKQSERPTAKFYMSKEDIVAFVKQTKFSLEILKVSDVETIQKLLEVLDSTTSDEETEEKIVFRRKRQAQNLNQQSVVDNEYVYTSLELMEKILQSVNGTSIKNEKTKIVAKVKQLAIKLCRNPKIVKEDIYTSIAAIQLEKLIGYKTFGKNFTISKHFYNVDGFFSINSHEIGEDKKYCLVVLQFPSDFIGNTENKTFFEILLYDLSEKGKLKEMNTGNTTTNIINLYIPNSGVSELKCLMWADKIWSTKNCKSSQSDNNILACQCFKFGYYRLGTINDDKSFLAQSSSPKVPSIINEISSQLPPIPTIGSTLPSTTKLVTSVPSAVATASQSQTPSLAPPSPSPITSPPLSTTPSVPAIPASNTPTLVTDPAGTIRTQTKKPAISSTANIAKAGSDGFLKYVIPIICVALILIVTGLLLLYRRRHKNQHRQQMLHQQLQFMSREPRPGITYAKFYDEHVMNGSFDT